ncbi:MAG: restriction endonuclease subunit M, partial [Bifidobacteriaceae bacterium]|nr:restriction endonuclease subunit M [Bifidobacteriaceae bacterium]
MPSVVELAARPSETVPSLADFRPGVFELLLSDMTTGGNIIWATADYAHLGEAFAADQPITVGSAGVIRPRVEKSRTRQGGRVKDKAEVFTPSWLCNEQNNLVDEAWFGRTGVFNTAIRRGWRTTMSPIRFDAEGERTWQRYVGERRLEAACGEAPYLVSRYDATTGQPIALQRRIGVLDRKLRVVTERCHDEDEWLRWARRAFQATYGFEFQGDNLLLARENLLATYVDYIWHALRRLPDERELTAVAQV